jgi:hypothetical protein
LLFWLAAGLSILVVTPNSCSGNIVQGAFSGSPCPLAVTLVWRNKLPLQSLPPLRANEIQNGNFVTRRVLFAQFYIT